MDAPSTGPRLHQLSLPRLGTHQPHRQAGVVSGLWSLAPGPGRADGCAGILGVPALSAQKMDLWFEGWAEKPWVD